MATARSTEFFTLEVTRNNVVVSQLPTQGYLLNAYWTNDGNYCAVNNRRGSSGDYLWVIHLPTGNAIKRPSQDEAADIVKRVHKKFPELSFEKFNRRYTLGIGWERGDKLRVRTELQFFNLNDQKVIVDQLCGVNGEQYSCTDEQIFKAPTKP